MKQIKDIISSRKVDVVVGFGGYASAPAYVASRRSRTPYVIHEANALPGLANKLGASKAAAVAVAFGSTKLGNSVLTGMPLRKEIELALTNSNQSEARTYFGLDPQMPTLLVTGGSLGARSINNGLVGAEAALFAAGIQVLHVVGGNSELEEVRSKGLVRIKYCDRMDLAIASADLAIARSGASTVCEFGAYGLPSVFVPYPVGNGEQRFNAVGLVTSGGAILVEDKDFDAEYIRDQVIPLLSNRKRLGEMAKAAKKHSIADGTERLYRLVRGVLPSNSAKSK